MDTPQVTAEFVLRAEGNVWRFNIEGCPGRDIKYIDAKDYLRDVHGLTRVGAELLIEAATEAFNRSSSPVQS